MKILDENLTKVSNKTFPGSTAFKLYDTYGFPLDLTADILKGKGIKVDNVGFEKEMEKSKALARANWKGSGDKTVEERWFKIREEINPTEFLGYEFDKAEGVVLKISKNNKLSITSVLTLPLFIPILIFSMALTDVVNFQLNKMYLFFVAYFLLNLAFSPLLTSFALKKLSV